MKLVPKENLKDFDVLFCWRDTELSEVIRLVSVSNFSHVAHVRVIEGEVFVVDAQVDGYNPKKWEDWVAKYGYTYIVMRDRDDSAENRAQKQLIEFEIMGSEYDFRGLLIDQPRKQITKFLNRFRTKDKEEHARQKNPDARFYCSEAEARVAGLRTDLSPGELYREMCNVNYMWV